MHSFRSLLDGLPPHSRALEAREVRTRPTSLSQAACPSFAWSPPLDPTLMEALAATYQVSQVYHSQSFCSVRKPLREFHSQAIEGRFPVMDGQVVLQKCWKEYSGHKVSTIVLLMLPLQTTQQ